MSEFDSIMLTFKRLTWQEFTTMLTQCEKVVNYIRHKPTNDLLATIVKFETGFEYRIDISDTIFLVGLKARTPVSGADVTVTPDDLLIYLAKPA
jgi:hypothetical protein